MEEFCEQSQSWLKKWLKVSNGFPCANTFARVFQALEPEEFAQCITTHLTQIGFSGLATQIAIDGKAMRGSRSGKELEALGELISKRLREDEVLFLFWLLPELQELQKRSVDLKVD